MAKIYTCTTCNATFDKFGRETHYASDAHAAAARQADAEKMAAMHYTTAALRAVRTGKVEIDEPEKALTDHTRWTLQRLNDDLAHDAAELEKACEYAAERVQRDIGKRVAERGAAAVYSGSQFQNLHEIPNLEGRVYGRKDTLHQLAYVLGYRCQATYEPLQWQYFERLADISAVDGDAADPGWRLESRAFGTLGGRFPTKLAAQAAACERVRATLDNERKAGAPKVVVR